MTSIVRQLQGEALDAKIPVGDLLRKVLFIATKLGIKETVGWAEQELNGYRKSNDVPDFRKLMGHPKVFDPTRGYIDLTIKNPEIADIICTHYFSESVGELEHLLQESAKAKTATLYYPFSHAQESRLMGIMNAPMKPFLEFSSVAIVGILDRLRNLILQWALELEQKGILGEDLSFTQGELSLATGSTVNIGMYVQNAHQSQFQNGTTNSQQSMDISGESIAEINGLIETIRHQLPSIAISKDQKSEIDAELDTIGAQLKSPRPKKGTIMSALGYVGSILKAAVKDGVAEELADKIDGLLP